MSVHLIYWCERTSTCININLPVYGKIYLVSVAAMLTGYSYINPHSSQVYCADSEIYGRARNYSHHKSNIANFAAGSNN